MFSSLIAQISQKFGLSAGQAELVIRAVLGFLDEAPQGLTAVVEQVKAAGLSGSPETWATASGPVLDGEKASAIFGSVAIAAIASTFKGTSEQAASIIGFTLPKVLGLISDHGVVPAGLPDAAFSFLKTGTLPPGLPPDHLVKSKIGDWLLRGVILAAALGLVLWLTPWHKLSSTPGAKETPPQPSIEAVEQEAHAPKAGHEAPAAAEKQPEVVAAPTSPARLSLREEDGVLVYEGSVANEDSRKDLLAALVAVYGADRIRGNVSVDPNTAPAPWLANLGGQLTALKFPGLDAQFEGNHLKVNSLPAGTDREALLGALRQSFASGSVTLPAAAQPVADRPARLSLRELGNKVIFGGAVPDSASADTIKQTLADVFGAENISGDLSVDPRYQAPGWLTRLGEFLGLVKSPGLNVVLDGSDVDIRAISPNVDRTSLLEKLKALFGGDVAVTLPDLSSPRLSAESALSALNALQSGYRGKDVAQTLNQVAIEFETGSATVPATEREVILKAAELIKGLPQGARVIIEGYTDNVGDAQMNLALSEQRAEAVKTIMVEAGVPAEDISATGYGDANPVDTNETPEGRAHNRRITYEIQVR
ncbi:OmpA family protein [Xanthobacter sp. TB0136]|uniref:OmpA family protein n=1 Tax=Xanthobacter sp. TB0136 TaxID=3459177 RepID=UPI0040398F82